VYLHCPIDKNVITVEARLAIAGSVSFQAAKHGADQQGERFRPHSAGSPSSRDHIAGLKCY
jgi:hypothetical protein